MPTPPTDATRRRSPRATRRPAPNSPASSGPSPEGMSGSLPWTGKAALQAALKRAIALVKTWISDRLAGARIWWSPDVRGRTGGVQETMEVNAHFGAPVMRTARPVHPLARQRLAASAHGRSGRRSRLGCGGERPQGHRCPVRARGRARLHTLAPPPSGVAPLESSLREGRCGRRR